MLSNEDMLLRKKDMDIRTPLTGNTKKQDQAKYDINLLLKWDDELGASDDITLGFCEKFLQKFKSQYSIFYPPEHQLGGSRYLTLPDDAKFTVAVITDSFLKNNTMKYIQEVFLMKHLENEDHYFIPIAIGLERRELPRDLQAMSVIHFDKNFQDNIKEWDRLEKSLSGRNSCKKENTGDDVGVVGQFWRPASPVSYYFSRIELHQNLLQHLEENPCLVLSGIHGCGKTQLARYLMCNFGTHTQRPSPWQMSDFEGGKHKIDTAIQFEVNCHSVGKILGSLEVLADHLGLKADANVYRNPTEAAKQQLGRILEILDQRRSATHNILLFEDVKRKTDNILTPSMIQRCVNTKIIVTTTVDVLWPLCQKYCVPVEGFTPMEAIQFFRTDNKLCKEKDDSIVLLGARLSFLPLGLAVAKMFMILYCESIEDYLDLLPENFLEENTFFKENEYDKGVIATMQRALESIKSNVGEEVFRAIEIVALFAPNRIPLQVVRKILPGSYQDKLIKERKVIEQLRDHSLASFQKNDQNQNIMTVHEIVQLALQLNWPQHKYHTLCEEAAFVLAGLVDKDYRVLEAYNTQWEFVPHVQTLLRHVSKVKFDNARAHISEIKLLDFLGHIYASTSTLHAEETLLLSRRKVFEYFVGKSEQEIDKEVRADLKEKESFCRMKAQCIHTILQSNPISENTLMEFVLKKTYYKQWYTRWEEKLQKPLNNLLKKDIQAGSLKTNQYDELIQCGVALPGHVIRKVYIGEIFVTTLYTCGLILFKDASETQKLSHDIVALCQEAFKVSFELSKLLCEDLKVTGCEGKLKHWLLVQEKGLLRMPLAAQACDNTPEEIVADITRKKQQFEMLGTLEVELYQQGVFKGTTNQLQTKVARTRQLIRCHRILLQHGKDVKQQDEIWKNAQKFLLCVETEFKQNTFLFQEFVNSAIYYVDLAMFLFQLGGRENLDKAISYLIEYLDKPALKGIQHIKALTCLTNVCLERKAKHDLKMCLQKLQEYEHELKSTSITKWEGLQSVTTNDLQEVTSLVKKIQNEFDTDEDAGLL